MAGTSGETSPTQIAFVEQTGPHDAEIVAGAEWLRSVVMARLTASGHADRFPVTIRYGKRQFGGGQGIPFLAQIGYLVALADRLDAAFHATCFIPSKDVDPDGGERAVMVLNLWLDRTLPGE